MDWCYKCKKFHNPFRGCNTFKTLVLSMMLTAIGLTQTLSAKAGDREQVIDAIIKAADTVEVPREVLLAVCWVESSYRRLKPRLDGLTRSYGICQVKLATARHMDTLYDNEVRVNSKTLQDDYTNAFYAAQYLKFQLKRYHGNVHKAVDAYNKCRVVSVNSRYVRKVMIAIEDATNE